VIAVNTTLVDQLFQNEESDLVNLDGILLFFRSIRKKLKRLKNKNIKIKTCNQNNLEN
jgi:hypothetical protein